MTSFPSDRSVHPVLCSASSSELSGPFLTSTCHPYQATSMVPVCPPIPTGHQPLCRTLSPTWLKAAPSKSSTMPELSLIRNPGTVADTTQKTHQNTKAL